MLAKVSIIMPTYNRGYIISRAIKSVIFQTYKEWELIIVDDGSNDDTEKRVNDFKDDRIKYIHYKKNRGGNYARNLGMENSNGEYIAFIDSDNEWYSNYLEKQMYWLNNPNEQIDVIFARVMIDNNYQNILFPCQAEEELNNDSKMIKQAMLFSIFDTNVCMLSRRVYNKSGGFNENLRRFQDWDYFLRLLLEKRYHFKFNAEILCTNYVQKNSISNTASLFWESRLYIFKHNLELCRRMGLVQEVLIRMLEDSNMEYILPQHTKELFSLLNSDEKAILCQNYYNNYISKVNNYNLSISHLNLAMKNDLILQIEKKWIEALINGKGVVNYFNLHNIKSIYIYGFGVLGELLWKELKDSHVQIKLIIDSDKKSDDVQINTLDEVNNFEVDEIVITAVASFDEISAKLRERTLAKIVSIEDVINEL